MPIPARSRCRMKARASRRALVALQLFKGESFGERGGRDPGAQREARRAMGRMMGGRSCLVSRGRRERFDARLGLGLGLGRGRGRRGKRLGSAYVAGPAWISPWAARSRTEPLELGRRRVLLTRSGVRRKSLESRVGGDPAARAPVPRPAAAPGMGRLRCRRRRRLHGGRQPGKARAAPPAPSAARSPAVTAPAKAERPAAPWASRPARTASPGRPPRTSDSARAPLRRHERVGDRVARVAGGAFDGHAARLPRGAGR